jgi:hypothetical protein
MQTETPTPQAQSPPPPPPKTGLQTKHIVLILGIVVVIAAAVVAVVLLTRPAPVEPVGEFPVINEANVKEITDKVAEKIDKGRFATYFNTTWSFPDGNSASTNAVMGNNASNNYPFWFELRVDGEVVMTSGLLPVGSELAEVKLDKSVPAGTYDAILDIHMVDTDGSEIETNASFDITVIVKS